MTELEIETTYLARSLPDGLQKIPFKEMTDIYIPVDSKHPKLRLRKNGDSYVMTKKSLVDPSDASTQIEETIRLSEDEYNALSSLDGKRVSKRRYKLGVAGKTAEIDVFQDDLAGLALIDIEFDSIEERDAFSAPDYCGPDVTQEDFIAGGMLAGKSYSDIEADLARYSYAKLSI